MAKTLTPAKSATANPARDWTLRDLSEFVLRRRKWIVYGAMLGCIASLAYNQFSPEEFQSTAKVLVMRKDSNLATRGVEANGGDRSRITEDLLATHMQMLSSQRVVGTALAEETPDHPPLATAESITAHLKPKETPLDYVLSNLSVTHGGSGQAKGAHVLNISFTHSDSVDAQRMVQALLRSYQQFLTEKFQDVNSEAATLIYRAQTELEADLDEAQVAYENFRRESPTVLWKSGDETTNIHRVRYEEIQQEISDLQLAASETESRLETVELVLNGRRPEELTDLERLSLIDEKNLERVGMLVQVDRSKAEAVDFLASGPTRQMQAQTQYDGLLRMSIEEKKLLSELGATHPEVLNAQQAIREMKQFLKDQEATLKLDDKANMLDPKKLIDAYVGLLKNDLSAARRREQQLLGLAAQEEEAARSMVSVELEGESLRKDLQRKQDLYDVVLDRLRDINLAKDYGGYINEVITEPQIGEKISPTPLKAIGLGLLTACVLGFAGAGLAEFRDRRFRSIEDLERVMKLPVLGQIPVIRKNRSSKAVRGTTATQTDPRMCVLRTPGSIESEAFRALRTSLLFGSADERRQLMAITSPQQGDGKSTMTANFAASLGQAGRKVVLVDCDLRRPSQHRLFGITTKIGLADVLQKKTDLRAAIQETPAENVWVIPAGALPSNPAELLCSALFTDVIDSLRERFDFVFLDCPPVLPVADSRIIAAQADAVVLVVNVEKNNHMMASRARDLLLQVGAEVVGVVANALNPRKFNSGYGYGYGYGYGGYGNNYAGGYASVAPAKVSPASKAPDSDDALLVGDKRPDGQSSGNGQKVTW